MSSEVIIAEEQELLVGDQAPQQFMPNPQEESFGNESSNLFLGREKSFESGLSGEMSREIVPNHDLFSKHNYLHLARKPSSLTQN